MLTPDEHSLISQALCKTLNTDVIVLSNETGIDKDRLLSNVKCVNERIEAFNQYEKKSARNAYLLEKLK